MTPKPETVLSARVRRTFESVGAVVVRLQSGKVRVNGGFLQLAEEGTADLLVLFPRGVPRFCEIKVPGKKPSQKQVAWRAKVQRLGFVVDTVYSVEEAIAITREVLGGKREHV